MAACGPRVPCGFGERDDGAGCQVAATFNVNLDERTDGSCDDDGQCSFRQGIGVNACAFEAFATTPELEDDACALYFYEEDLQDSFAVDAGFVEVTGLAGDPVLMAPPAEGECYDTDLFPTRSELFEPGSDVRIEGFGGAAAPAFSEVLSAPAALVVDRPTEVQRGEDLAVEWTPGESARVIFVVDTHDGERGSRVLCTADDEDGIMTVSAAMIDALIETEVAHLLLLRQRAAHLEPENSALVVELQVTTSDAVRVPLRE